MRRRLVVENHSKHRKQMSIRVGINGFGRVGRLGFRAGWDDEGIEIVHVNEFKGGCEMAAHLLEYDTVHGRWDRDIEGGKDRFLVGGREVTFSDKATPGEVDWAGMGIDLVVESTGAFRTADLLQPYFDGGVRKVVVAAPVGEALNIVKFLGILSSTFLRIFTGLALAIRDLLSLDVPL